MKAEGRGEEAREGGRELLHSRDQDMGQPFIMSCSLMATNNSTPLNLFPLPSMSVDITNGIPYAMLPH